MKKWFPRACLALGTVAVLSASQLLADQGRSSVVVDIKPERIILMDLVRAGDRLLAVGERGFVLMSNDGGKSWTSHSTPVTRTLTGVAFEDAKLGVAVGHGGSLVRTEDGGDNWVHVPLEEAGTDSLLGVVNVGGGHFIAYGAFGLYFDSRDGGRTWTRQMILSDDFDRHISQILPVGDRLLLVAESGTLALSGDGGANWLRLKSPYEGSYFGAVQTGGSGVVVFGMRGTVYRTDALQSVDWGAALAAADEAKAAAAESDDPYGDMAAEDEGIEIPWQKVDIDTTASLMAGKLLADGRLLIVGNAGLLALSKDNGQSLGLHWVPDSRGIAQVVEADGQLIAVGERGVSTIDPAWLAAN